MQDLSNLIALVRNYLTEVGAELPREEVYTRFFQESRSAGITEEEFYKYVLKPAYKSVDWEALEQERKAAAARKAAVEAQALAQAEAEKAAGLMDLLIQTKLSDSIITRRRLETLFEAADLYNQDHTAVAAKIRSILKVRNYQPWPVPSVANDKEALLCAEWYTPEQYGKLQASLAPPPSPTPPPPLSPQTLANPPKKGANRLKSVPVPPKPAPQRPSPPWQEPRRQPLKRRPHVGLWLGIPAALLLVVYVLWLRPYWRDQNAERFYAFADNLSLRSSRSSDNDLNFIKQLPYGAELLVYEKKGDWAQVKVKADGREGYVALKYLLDQSDFFLLNSIFPDSAALQTIATVRCRKALLQYYKEHRLLGTLDPETRQKLFGGQPMEEGWEYIAANEDQAAPNVAYPRISAHDGRFTDFACVIVNHSLSKRRFLLFSFDDETEEPQLLTYQNAPLSGCIRSIKQKKLEGRPYYVVEYSKK